MNEAVNSQMISIQGRAILQLEKSYFSKNNLDLNGGMIYISVGGLINMTSCTFEENNGNAHGILLYILNTYRVSSIQVIKFNISNIK